MIHIRAYERTENCPICKDDVTILFCVAGGDDEDLDLQPEGRICPECRRWVHRKCHGPDLCTECETLFAT